MSMNSNAIPEVTMTDDSSTIPGKIIEDVVILPGHPWGRKLTKGQQFRIIDLEGKQAVDFLLLRCAGPQRSVSRTSN